MAYGWWTVVYRALPVPYPHKSQERERGQVGSFLTGDVGALYHFFAGEPSIFHL